MPNRKKCLEILVQHDWPVTIHTKSAILLRDTALLRRTNRTKVGLTVTAGDDRVRRLCESKAPPVIAGIKTLEGLHSSGIRTYAMIAPMLPKAKELVAVLKGKVAYILMME